MLTIRRPVRLCLLLAFLLAAGCSVPPATPAPGGPHNASGAAGLESAQPADLARQIEQALKARDVTPLRTLTPPYGLAVCVYHGPCSTRAADEALAKLSEVLRNARSVHVEVLAPHETPVDVVAGSLGDVNLRVEVEPLVTPDPMSGVFYYDTVVALRMTDAGWEWFAWHLKMST